MGNPLLFRSAPKGYGQWQNVNIKGVKVLATAKRPEVLALEPQWDVTIEAEKEGWV